MKISRRGLLLGAVTTTVLTNIWDINSAKAKIVAGSAAGDKDLVKKMVRTLYPHDRFPDGPYERTADDVINKANANPGMAIMFEEGLAELKSKKFEKMSFRKATKYMKKIEGSAFFNHVRGTSVVTLYNDKEVWGLLGYEGYSSDKGGYINRGFNDLDWLPEPRIEEHPELASFLSESPKKLASLKKQNLNN